MAAIRTQREIRQRAPWWLIGLLALNFALMTYDARDDTTKQRKIRSIVQMVAYPFQRGASSVGNGVTGFFGNIGELRRASVENQQLREQVRQMQDELRDTRQQVAEAERLEKLLDLKAKSSYETEAAQVIARDPSMWFDNIVINKGRWSGVEVNASKPNGNLAGIGFRSSAGPTPSGGHRTVCWSASVANTTRVNWLS